MSFFKKVKKFFSNIWEKTASAREVLCKTGHYMKMVFHYIFKFRAIFLVLITIVAAIMMASYCKANLPESVGIALQSDGSFSQYITRDQAVNSSFLLTAFSLIFVLISKKTLYPWLISLFTFVVPVLVLVTNYLAGAI